MKPSNRMIELRRRLHDLLHAYKDVAYEYMESSCGGGDEDSQPNHPVLDQWLLIARWADLEPAEDGPEAWLVVVDSGCSEVARIGLATILYDYARN